MGWKGLERNKLDYILTDLLPVELSELFSFRSFYDFLMKNEQQAVISSLVEDLKKEQAKATDVMFRNRWATTPFKYNILKTSDSLRVMSIIQPLSALNLYLFIECYQKDILNFFTKNHFYSIRYHKKNSDLYYKTRSKRAIEYFPRETRQRIGKAAVQQTGNFFKIAMFESINSFIDSRLWRIANFKYKYYAKMDYKSCFDSIYSHVYKWIIERNVIDSKDANNSNLFITIDRILQNINGKQSNGLIVGPEFSRMIAEVLLQQVDTEIMFSLLRDGLTRDKNYIIFRYVDDIFIFADSQENLDKIISTFGAAGNHYLLRLNELKLSKGVTPCLPKKWLERTRILADVIDSFFGNQKKAEYDKLPEEEKHLIKKDYFPIDRIKDEFTTLMIDFQNDKRTIVSFLLSALLNNISKKKDGFRLFADRKTDKAFLLIDLALFMYTFSPTFDSTRKFVSMIVYMNDEVHFNNKDSLENKKLENTIRRYSFIFHRGNLPDLCDWFPFLAEFSIALDTVTENIIIEKAMQDNNPIILANILLYSRYYTPFFENIKNKVEAIVETQISRMSHKQQMMQVEFWYALIFHNCSFLSASLRIKIESILDDIESVAIKEISNPNTSSKLSARTTLLVCDFLKQKLPNGRKPCESFYNWSESKKISEQITYRTLQRTIFKRYRGNRYGLYVSID
jgi:hypothetical protein